MSRSLIVLPDDSSQPLIEAIERAKSSLRVKMFVFSDPLPAGCGYRGSQARRERPRDAQSGAPRWGKRERLMSGDKLKAAGIDVIDSNPSFDVTHEKSMVIDDAVAYIESLNWETRNLTETRDYAVVTSHKHEVDEVIQGFDADWNRTEFRSGDHLHLIWCIGNGRQRMCEFIDRAKHTLWLQNERYQDPVVIEHLVRAHTRGVKIRGDGSRSAQVKREIN